VNKKNQKNFGDRWHQGQRQAAAFCPRATRGSVLYFAAKGDADMSQSEPASIFDLEPDEAHEARLDAEAEADYQAGRFVPHEQVREWLLKLAKGEKTPPPGT